MAVLQSALSAPVTGSLVSNWIIKELGPVSTPCAVAHKRSLLAPTEKVPASPARVTLKELP